MDGNDRYDRLWRDVAHALRSMVDDDNSDATTGANGARRGMPTWEERTRHLRPSQRVKMHGYPFGFAKSQHHLRSRLEARFDKRSAGLDDEDQARLAAAHEAVARALDWERLLGSFNHVGQDHLPVDTIDRVADHILVWLDHLGFAIVAKEGGEDEPLPDVPFNPPNVFDIARGMIVLIPEQEER